MKKRNWAAALRYMRMRAVANYEGVVDVYAESQKKWFAERKSALQPVLFTAFQNWSLNARVQNK
jgi:DNA polymerase phi